MADGTKAKQQGFAARLTPLVARCGVVAVPALLLRYQARLALSHAEVIYLLHVLNHRWDGNRWPWLAVSTVAEAAGVHEGVARRWKASLEAKGYIRCKPRVVPGIGRRADEHDLSPLFAALETLALEEETQKRLEEMRDDLPVPTFALGISTTPQLSTGRLTKKLRARPNENVRAGGNESVRAPRTKRGGRGPAETPGETEPTPRAPLEKMTPEEILAEHTRRLRVARGG